MVNDCFAHNGAHKKIQLIDEYGYLFTHLLKIKILKRVFRCPVDDKLISRFRGSWSETGVYETQVFAYMKTFRFTGSPALYIECDVRMCHGRCPVNISETPRTTIPIVVTFQSQPCHWRNVKNVKKRSIEATTQPTTLPTNTAPLSENVNLFQALRVLQEGESEEERNVTLTRYGDFSLYLVGFVNFVNFRDGPQQRLLKNRLVFRASSARGRRHVSVGGCAFSHLHPNEKSCHR